MERKALSFEECEIKFANGKPSQFTGYASKFGNVDSDGDVVVAGAFDQIIETGVKPKMFFNHNHYAVPIGKYSHLETDEVGLIAHGEFTSGISMAKDVQAAMQDGTVDGLSWGGLVSHDDTEWQGDGTRLIKVVNTLREISVVTYPSNDEARVDLGTFKSALHQCETIRDFERFLREAGSFSKSLAEATTKRAKVLFAGEPRGEAGVDEINQMLNRISAKLEG
ncbi:HK97 family phage prohead protease [Microbulbifer sp. VVAC002]|uniref:HK97 family phage prohead protease n=1 Tax=Microbulbifer sp. VVAC002 TaxID=3243387 RepID=UPI00403955E0